MKNSSDLEKSDQNVVKDRQLEGSLTSTTVYKMMP